MGGSGKIRRLQSMTGGHTYGKEEEENPGEQGETFLHLVFKAGCESRHLASVFVFDQGQSSWLFGSEKPAHPETVLVLMLATKLGGFFFFKLAFAELESLNLFFIVLRGHSGANSALVCR